MEGETRYILAYLSLAIVIVDHEIQFVTVMHVDYLELLWILPPNITLRKHGHTFFHLSRTYYNDTYYVFYYICSSLTTAVNKENSFIQCSIDFVRAYALISKLIVVGLSMSWQIELVQRHWQHIMSQYPNECSMHKRHVRFTRIISKSVSGPACCCCCTQLLTHHIFI
jgi:hypothetical protein